MTEHVIDFIGSPRGRPGGPESRWARSAPPTKRIAHFRKAGDCGFNRAALFLLHYVSVPAAQGQQVPMFTLLMIAAGVVGGVYLMSQRRRIRIPLRYYAIVIGMMGSGIGLLGIAQTLRLAILIYEGLWEDIGG